MIITFLYPSFPSFFSFFLLFSLFGKELIKTFFSPFPAPLQAEDVSEYEEAHRIRVQALAAAQQLTQLQQRHQEQSAKDREQQERQNNIRSRIGLGTNH
jgi:hypothetical protein